VGSQCTAMNSYLARYETGGPHLLIALDALLQAEDGSRAAARVGLSTPVMSHALSRLRAQVGDPLLVRSCAPAPFGGVHFRWARARYA
jgi:DNA-binding transcriptional LysR family regulator